MNDTRSDLGSDIEIRCGCAADLNQIADYNCRLALESEELQLDPERVQKGVSAVLNGAAEARYIVAARGERILGQLMLTREWSDWRNAWFYWIQSVYVVSDARRLGLFRRLVDEAQRAVSQESTCAGLRLYVADGNAAAQEVYQRLGWRDTGYRVLERPADRT